MIGAGGVGLGLGSCLLHAGSDVLFVVRDGRQVAALRGRSVERTGVFGTVTIPPERFDVDARPARIAAWQPDYVLVCTKTTACDAVAGALADACGEPWRELASPPPVVLCLNGWGNAERFARRLPPDQVFNARVITGFRQGGPGRVEVTVHAEAIHVGSLFGADLDRVAPLCRAIAAGGIPCAPSAEIAKDLLAKLLYNCALNPLAALRGVPYGALGDHAASRAALSAVVREIFAVLDAAGLETHWRSPDAYLAFFWDELLPKTGRHESSMLQDLRAGRPTEIDALCGAVVDLARAHGAEAPVNFALATLIRAIERGPRAGSRPAGRA